MKLEEIISENHEEIYDLLAQPEPFSVFEDYVEFKFLILRRIELDSESHLQFPSEAFLLKDKRIYHFRPNTKDFKSYPNGAEELALDLDSYYSNNQKIIHGFSQQVEQLEDFLFGRNVPPVFMDIWFGLKKDLSKLENYYHRNGIVYREFLRKAESHFGDFIDEFRDIEDEIRFQSSNIDTVNTRLDGVYRHFESIKGDRLNKTLLMLTIISGIFLPLNLIVGFFGMNTPGLYFMDNPHGTSEVVVLLLSVLAISLLGIPIISLLNKYFLRFILGRYHFYQKFYSRIEEFGDRLKGK